MAEFRDEEGVFEAGFESPDAEILVEEITSFHCRNIFERLRDGSDASWTDHHG